MKLNEALQLMNEKVDAAEKKFIDAGVTVTRETRYMNAIFAEIPSERGARFVSVTLNLSAENVDEENIFCLSLTAEIKKGAVNEEKLNLSFAEFDKYVESTEKDLKEGESLTAAINELSRKANEDYEKLLDDLNKMKAKQQKISFLSTVIVLVGVVILFAIAALS